MEEYKIIYKNTYNNFKDTLKRAKSLSVTYSGISAPTQSHFFSSLIFTKLCVSGETISRNCPSFSQLGCNAHWDFASVAALTRGIIEAYLTFFYLCIENCSCEEWETRWRLMNLHDHLSRYKMFLAANDTEESEKFNRATDDVKSDLKKSRYFQSLPEKKRKHFLKGNTPFLLSKDEIVERFGGEINDFRYLYRFLSNNTHTYPMGFYRMTEGARGCGVETDIEVQYTIMCLSWADQYLTLAIDAFSKKWEGVKKDFF